MSLYDVRETGDTDRGGPELVQEFFADLGAGRLSEARSKVAPSFSWFGAAIADSAWDGPPLRSFATGHTLSTAKAREVPRLIIDATPEVVRDDAFGPVGSHHRVVLIDVTRDGKTSTALVVTSADQVVRVSDPERFIAFVKMAASC